MSGIRWIALATGLVGTFLVSAAVGGLIARQLNATPSVPPVAVASPSPAPVATATAVPATAAPTAIPTAPPPTAAATETPTAVTPTAVPPTVAPTIALDPPTVEDFAADLADAIQEGDRAYLNERLHPATLERYGQAACRRHIRDTFTGADFTWVILGSSGPAPWDYVTDGLTTTIPDGWTVDIRQPGADPERRDFHFAPADGTWRWFTDCGDPR